LGLGVVVNTQGKKGKGKERNGRRERAREMEEG